MLAARSSLFGDVDASGAISSISLVLLYGRTCVQTPEAGFNRMAAGGSILRMYVECGWTLHSFPAAPTGGSPPEVGHCARSITYCMMVPLMSTHRRGASDRTRRSSTPHGLQYRRRVMRRAHVAQTGVGADMGGTFLLVQGEVH